MMLKDSTAIETLARENTTLFEKMADWLRDFFDKIREAFAGVEAVHAEARALMEADSDGVMRYIDGLQALWDKALVSAARNVQGAQEAQGGAKGSHDNARYLARQAYDYSKPFAQQIEDWINGQFPRNDTLLLGRTPNVFRQIGFSDLPLTMDQKHLDYAVNGTKNDDHAVPLVILQNLPELLQEPIAIIESATHPADSVMAIVDATVNGKQMMAAFHITSQGVINGYSIDANHMASVQGRKNAVTKLLLDAINKENANGVGVYYIDKKRGVSILKRKGLQLPSSLNRGGLIHSIADSKSPVNRQFVNQTETQQFKRWFGKSKVVDAEGKPLVMYRGGEEIHVFDRKKSRASNLYGRGFYFTESEQHAKQYGEARRFYLRIENPLSAGSGVKKITQKQMRAFLEAIADDEDFGLDNYGYGATVDSVLAGLKGKTDFDALQDINATAIGDFVAAIELFNDVNGTNYDGIITPTETVVFDSTQIKSATDNVGTFDPTNPDIRYQARDADTISSREALANALETAAKNDLERGLLADYKKIIQSLNEDQEKLAGHQKIIRELSFKKGGLSQQEKDELAMAKNRAEIVRNRLNRNDKKLLNLEATEALKAVVARERVVTERKIREEKDKQLAEYRERTRDTLTRAALRDRIKHDVKALNRLLLNETDVKHVPEELKGAVAQFLTVFEFRSCSQH